MGKLLGVGADKRDRSIFSKRPIHRSAFKVVHANAERIPVSGSVRFAGAEWTSRMAVRAGDSDEWRPSPLPSARRLTDRLSKLSRAILKTVVCQAGRPTGRCCQPVCRPTSKRTCGRFTIAPTGSSPSIAMPASSSSTHQTKSQRSLTPTSSTAFRNGMISAACR